MKPRLSPLKSADLWWFIAKVLSPANMLPRASGAFGQERQSVRPVVSLTSRKAVHGYAGRGGIWRAARTRGWRIVLGRTERWGGAQSPMRVAEWLYPVLGTGCGARECIAGEFRCLGSAMFIGSADRFRFRRFGPLAGFAAVACW